MNTISTLGIDIAKNTFQLHGADHTGKAIMRKRMSRHQLAAYVANLAPCTVVIESCGGANYWARVFQRSGHTAKLISPQFVKPLTMCPEFSYPVAVHRINDKAVGTVTPQIPPQTIATHPPIASPHHFV